MRFTFTIEFHRDEPEPEPYREVVMGSQAELAQPSIGFAAPDIDMPYERGPR